MKQEELYHFKEMLEKNKLQILKNIDGLNQEIHQLSRCELNDEGDFASVNSSVMVENQIEEQQRQELKAIERALAKIASKEYGTCEMCGVKIGVPRLSVKPHAIYCIDCRGYVEKAKR